MSADNLSGQLVSSTFQRLLQLSENNNNVINGTGSMILSLPVTASHSVSSSFTTTSSYASYALSASYVDGGFY